MQSSVDQWLNSAPFHGAALVDGQGREIPITECMVQQALVRLMGQELLRLTRAHWAPGVAAPV